MRRRLELAQALVHNPRVLFLDEPTVELDVSARKKIWEHISTLRNAGMCIFVTTHYMDEADRYCDRVAIIDKGVIRVVDTPAQLKSMISDDVISVIYPGFILEFLFPGFGLSEWKEITLSFILKTGRRLSRRLNMNSLPRGCRFLRCRFDHPHWMMSFSTWSDRVRIRVPLN
jgi:ABC-2 type transport system ATP-binding protein